MDKGETGGFREWWRRNLPGLTPKRKRDWFLLVGYLLAGPSFIRRIGGTSFGFPLFDRTFTLFFLAGVSLIIATLVVSGIHDLVCDKRAVKGITGLLSGVLLASVFSVPSVVADRVLSGLADDSSGTLWIEKQLARQDLTAKKRSVLSRNRASYIFWRDGSLESYQTPEGKAVLFVPTEEDWKARSTFEETRRIKFQLHWEAVFSVWYFSLLLLASAGAGTAVCLRKARKKKSEEVPRAVLKE